MASSFEIIRRNFKRKLPLPFRPCRSFFPYLFQGYKSFWKSVAFDADKHLHQFKARQHNFPFFLVSHFCRESTPCSAHANCQRNRSSIKAQWRSDTVHFAGDRQKILSRCILCAKWVSAGFACTSQFSLSCLCSPLDIWTTERSLPTYNYSSVV